MNLKGYIFSRKYLDERTPQHVQNIVIREYCKKNNFNFLLSATEYAFDNSFLMLKSVLDEIKKYDGVIAYSLFQLPEEEKNRINLLRKIVKLNKCFHFACEGMSVNSSKDIDIINDIWIVRSHLKLCPSEINY
ncbi:hypothetical protein OBA18_01000 [Pelagibacteraceae bacterium]|nr:hypothetical protein [Pelagibacteraceae bacterium]